MAYYSDEEDKLATQQEGPVQTGQSSGLLAGQGSSPTAASAASQAPVAGDRSGSFTGIKQYLDQNKVQGDRLGNQVAGKVDGVVQDASQEISGLGSKFNAKADAGQIANIQNAVADASAITNTAATGSTPLSADQKNRFGEVANAEYRGPNALIDTELYEPAFSKTQKASQYATLSGDEGGRQQLLKEVAGSPTYTAGQNKLDSFLLSSDANKAKLQNSAKNAAALKGMFDSADASASSYAAQQKALADQVKADSRKNNSEAQLKRNAEVESDLNAISKDWRNEYENYLSILKNSGGGSNLQLTPEQMQKLGLEKGQRIFNLLNPASGNTPEQYLKLENFDANKAISKEQQAQLAALDELASQYGGDQKNKYTQAQLAGTLNPQSAFDGSALGRAATQAETNFQANVPNVTLNASGELGNWGGYDITDTLNHYFDGSFNQREALPVAKQAWIAEVLKYLQQAGYNNTAQTPKGPGQVIPNKG